MIAPEWWWTGLLLQFTIFLFLILLLTWLLLSWAQRQMEHLSEEVHHLEVNQRQFEADMRARLWQEEEEE